MDILFNLGLLLVFIGLMKLCYEAWMPKPYTKVHMRDFRKRLGK